MRSAILFLAALAGACASTDETKAVSAMKDARAAAAAGDFDGAKASAERAAELRPGFVDPLMLLAAIAEKRGDVEEARRRYREVLTHDPTATAAGVALGFTYVRTGEFDEASAWFTKAITADPGSEAAAYNLGSLAESRRDLETAAAWFDVAAALDAGDPRAPTRLAAVRLAQNRPKDALDAADTALRRWPDSKAALAIRERARAALGGRAAD
jgi:Flp pilus assembly protein TadD